MDFVALKAEELGRMAQHAHGLICSRFFKLYNIEELMEKGSEMVMSWMGCVATSVIGTTSSFIIRRQFWSIKSNAKGMERNNCQSGWYFRTS